ncbi:MAG: ShlB/FhaC/HecB family hemolysin secretion/activation protein [Nevskia sp.]|nr:ShlB/FhaC/HecB family hemolysin secretion/activation protein [Nevskia sp.]
MSGISMCLAAGSARAAPPAANPPAAAKAAPAAAKATPASRIDLWEIDVDGNTVLDAAAIDAIVAPFLGESRTFKDVDDARAALEEAYRDHGYKTVTVAIPRQTVHDGVVVLQVTEERVGHLTVVGSKYHSIDQIKLEAPSLAEGSVPDFNRVQKDIVALNGQPDRRVTPALKAGATPGTVDIDLVVEDHLPLHASAEINNRRSQDTSELRTLGTLSYDNLWQSGHSLSVSYQTAPQNQSDARVLFGSYLARFGGSRFSLLFNALKSDSNVATVGGTNVLGNGQMYGVRGVLQLPGGEGYYPSVTFGMDYKHFKTLTSLGGSSFNTPVEYFPFTLGYSGLFRADGAVTQADLSMVLASPRLGSSTEVIQLNRANARGQMFYLRGDVSHTEDFAHGVQGFVRFAGQITDQPLISNEQFSAGGMDTVRGYLEAETLGDYGFNASAEVRGPSWGENLKLGSWGSPVQDFRLFAFVDGSQLLLRDPLPDQQSRFNLMSVGTGVNLRLFSYVNGVLDWADPLLAGSATRAWSSRIVFRVWTNY